MTEREKRITIVVTVIVIILLLFFFLRKARRGTIVIPVYDDPNLDYDLGSFAIDLGDLIIPELTFFRGVTACGCGPKDEKPYQPLKPSMPAPAPAQGVQRLNYQSQPRRSSAGLSATYGAPLPPKNYEHNSNFWGGNWGG